MHPLYPYCNLVVVIIAKTATIRGDVWRLQSKLDKQMSLIVWELTKNDCRYLSYYRWDSLSLPLKNVPSFEFFSAYSSFCRVISRGCCSIAQIAGWIFLLHICPIRAKYVPLHSSLKHSGALLGSNSMRNRAVMRKAYWLEWGLSFKKMWNVKSNKPISNKFVSNNFITYICSQKTLNIWL